MLLTWRSATLCPPPSLECTRRGRTLVRLFELPIHSRLSSRQRDRCREDGGPNMKINHDGSRAIARAGLTLGGAVCALLMATGCGPGGREALQDLLDSLGNGHGHGGHGGGGGNGGGGNEPPIECATIDFDNLYQLINDDLSGEDADDSRNFR